MNSSHTVIIDRQLWRTLALTYCPMDNMTKVMYNQYGLVRKPITRISDPFLYDVIDEQKYLIFLLRWK